MASTNFNTDLFRDLTFDLLSGVAHDPTKIDELINAYLIKLHDRDDLNDLRKYTNDIYEKFLALHIVQSNSSSHLKNLIHDKILIFYFFRISDIHSAQMTPKFVSINKHYNAAGVEVIGIHSPKYEHLKNKNTIRHGIEEESFPFSVVNDNGLQVWKHVGGQIFPTALIFGPDGVPIFIFEGENHIQHTEKFLLPILAYYKSSLRTTPISSVTVTSPEDTATNTTTTSKSTKLTYPSHICITSNGQLVVSFSGSNQLILCEMDGKVIDIVGNGQSGLADGEIQQVEFDSPHGLAEFNSCIYIADTNNHSIRVFDPTSRRVLTLIGTGRLGSDKVGGLKRSQQPIASPWDLCIAESPFDHKTVLIIAMTGHHQIWAYAFEETQWWNNTTLEKNSCSAIVGSGVEENRNDTKPMSASLSAPRGICRGLMNGQPALFIADSNSSTIRVVSLESGNVSHIIGGDSDPTNLSAFGDLDGSGFNARLQYPIGIAYDYSASRLFISDTYNNKLKFIDLKTLVCSSYFATDIDTKKQRGESNSAKFYQPQGLAIFEQFMFVADKNNSHIKRVDLNKGTVVRYRFDLTETLQEERSFGSKQAYLSIVLPDTLQLRESNTGTWAIEDQDGFKICDGEITRSMSDQILLDYIPRDKQVAQLKYELFVCEDEKCAVMSGTVQPSTETDYAIEYVVKIDQSETNIN